MAFTVPSVISTIALDTTISQIFQAQSWTLLTILKNTSGVVSVGTNSDVSVSASGRGFLLPTGTPITIFVGPATTLYGTANAAGESVGLAAQVHPEVDILIDTLSVLLKNFNTQDAEQGFSSGPSVRGVMPDMLFPGTKEFEIWKRQQKAKK